jgi:hypothetical protein
MAVAVLAERISASRTSWSIGAADAYWEMRVFSAEAVDSMYLG